jgi:hypothetical protein
MLKRPCPHCSAQIAFFSPEWQVQRASSAKVCPLCGKPVVVQFRAITFATWFAGFVVVSAIAGCLFGRVACMSLLVAAVPATLLASLHVYRDASPS